MATTVGDIITSARYDLGDFGGQKYDDDQLVDYVNRIIVLLDEILITQNSDFTLTSGTATLNSGEYSFTAPTRSHIIIAIFDGTRQLIKESFADVMYRYQINNESSTTGSPSYWAYNNGNIICNVEADDDYTLTVHYHVKTAALTIIDNLPYNDFFNQYIREALVTMASKSVDDKVVNVDKEFYMLFKHAVASAVVGRNFVSKPYHLGF